MKSRKNKLFAAFALGILVISGLANAYAMNDSSSLTSQSAGTFKEIRNNPFNFIKAEKILVPQNFDYLEQMNNEFAGGFDDGKSAYVIGDSLRALEEKDNRKKKA